MQARLGYVIRYPADLGRSVQFYRDLLGLEVAHTDDGYVAFDTGEVTLALLDRTRVPELFDAAETGAPPDDRHEGEVAFFVDDVRAASRELEEEGFVCIQEPLDRPWGERTAYFKDPDGYLVELAQKI